MDMKQIITLFFGLSLFILTSCSTQQRVVYRNCDCNTTNFDLRWNNHPFWGWNDRFWGWNTWNFHPYTIIPRYYVYPNRVQPSQPTRYERKTSIGARPSRSNTLDNTYPQRNQTNQNVQVRPSQQNTQPSRIQNNSNRYVQPQQRTNQSSPSRIQNSTPSRVQQRVNTPSTNQPPRSRVQNEPISGLKPKWYVPQQSHNGMVTPQFVYWGNEGRMFSGPGGFQRND